MNVQIIKVEETKKGKFDCLNVDYKNLENGKVASKPVMQFHGAYEVLKAAKAGQDYNVKAAKDKNGYWIWDSAAEGIVGVPKTQVTQPAPRSTFETPEERARRQVYIVRQSSLATAVEYINGGNTGAISPEEVIKLADKFARYVLDVQPNPLQGIVDLEDDIPS